MADRTEQSIVISADAQQIMAVIADFESYPEWVDAAKSVTVTARSSDGLPETVSFELDAGFLRDTYQLSYQWSRDGRSVSWDLVSSVLQKTQHGQYRLQQAPGEGGTLVTYSLEVTLEVPVIGLLRRKAEKTITDTALKELKRRVEGKSADEHTAVER